MLRVLSASVCLALVWCTGCTTETFTDVPIQSCSGLPCVEAQETIGRPLRLVLDFASPASYVSATVVRDQYVGRVTPLRIGSAVLSDHFVVVDPNSQKSLGQIVREHFPGGDGGLALTAFGDRPFVLDLRHHRLRIYLEETKESVCPRVCGKLVMTQYGDIAAVPVIGADSFSLNDLPVTVVIDPLYEGSVVLSQPVYPLTARPERDREGRLHVPGTPVGKTYHSHRLFSLGQVLITFAGGTVCSSATLLRYDIASFGSTGVPYDATIGRTVLSRFALAFDVRTMQIWVADLTAIPPPACD